MGPEQGMLVEELKQVFLIKTRGNGSGAEMRDNEEKEKKQYIPMLFISVVQAADINELLSIRLSILST